MDQLLSTAALLYALDGRRPPTMALRDMFFPTPFQSDDESIVLDELGTDLEVAAFVSPLVETPDSKMVPQRAESFKPGYIKERNRILPSHGQVRRPGEQLSGTEDAGTRLNAVIERQVVMQDDRISRREELMCSEILRTGKVAISGDNIATYEADFNRDASLTDALTGGDRWGQSGVKIIDYLEGRAEAVGDVSGGSPSVVILGAAAAAVIRDDDKIRDGLDNTRQAGGSFQFGPRPAAGDGNHLVYLGTYGDFEFYKLRQKFTVEGVSVDVWPTGSCLVADPAFLNGFMCHGAVLDRGAGVKPLPRYPKMWDNEDPAGTFLLTQSAPLPVPGNINATAYSLVV